MRVGDRLLELRVGDITDLEVDAIVNPANERLVLGGGVAGAIRRKGGPKVQEECDRIGYCPVGSAVITSGGNLRAKYVIHAVGPRWGEEGVEEKLRSATLSSLRLADQYNLRSVALPAISTGAFGVPMGVCADVMIPAVLDYLAAQTGLRHVIICLFREGAYRTFADALKRHAEARGLLAEG
ncbi:MAG: macro domain-containing protein [Candidatus Nezhaarchaeales archaeon]